ncbi:ISNCY family transposase [Aerococcaceae bacterium 50-4]
MGEYLTMAEINKYEIIKNVHLNRTTKAQASIKLEITVRQVNRLLEKYRNEGRKGFKHGNTKRPPTNKHTTALKKRIVALYQTKYEGFNIKHFREKLISDEGIEVSYTSLRDILNASNIISPRANRKTKRALREKLETRAVSSKPLTNREKERLEAVVSVGLSSAHPTRSRRKYAGELVQMDASQHKWFQGDEQYYHLHAAVDDATGSVIGAHFAFQETLDGYYEITEQILLQYGIPYQILTDNRTVFSSNVKEKDSSKDQRASTQYGYACQTLGIELITTSIPQAKGRIERLFNTFQDRLYNEMRLQGIRTMTQANKFLPSYLAEYNKQFALPIKDSMNIFEKLEEGMNVAHILARFTERKIQSGHDLQLNNVRYHLYNKSDQRMHLKKGTTVLIIETKTGDKYASYKNELFRLESIPQNKSYSKVFDLEVIEKPAKKPSVTIPPMSHPWKQHSYQKYLYQRNLKTASS